MFTFREGIVQRLGISVPDVPTVEALQMRLSCK